MTDAKMSFKDEFIANLQPDRIEWRTIGDAGEFVWFPLDIHDTSSRRDVLDQLIFGKGNPDIEFRIKPRTVMCNGVEVPAPETVAPDVESVYFVPSTANSGFTKGHLRWENDDSDVRWLERGLVYLREEHAIARAKAMLITK